MAQIEKQINIKFIWWENEIDKMDEEHTEVLEKAAFGRIVDMMKEGYNAGELHHTIDDIQYDGWWDLEWSTL